MSNSLLLTLIGLIATVIFGALSIYKHKYPGRITFVKLDSIRLFDSIVKSFPSLSILYNSKPVNENLVLFKGAFHNTGSLDITINKPSVEQKLTICLPEGSKWMERKVFSPSTKAEAEINNVEQSRLEFDIGLFRCDEVIYFEALAEIPAQQNSSGRNLKRSRSKQNEPLTISHRIANTQRVKIEDLSPFTLGFSFVALTMAAVTVLLFGYLNLNSWLFDSKRVNYLVNSTSGDVFEVSVILEDDGLIDIKGEKIKQPLKMPVSDFFSERVNPRSVAPHKLKSTILFLLRTALPLSLLMYLIALFMDRRMKKKRAKFELAKHLLLEGRLQGA